MDDGRAGVVCEKQTSSTSSPSKSVRELRQWLSEFGERNRVHYHDNKRQGRAAVGSSSSSASSSDVYRKIHAVENKFSASSTSSSSSSSSSSTPTTPTTPSTTTTSGSTSSSPKKKKKKPTTGGAATTTATTTTTTTAAPRSDASEQRTDDVAAAAAAAEDPKNGELLLAPPPPALLRTGPSSSSSSSSSGTGAVVDDSDSNNSHGGGEVFRRRSNFDDDEETCGRRTALVPAPSPVFRELGNSITRRSVVRQASSLPSKPKSDDDDAAAAGVVVAATMSPKELENYRVVAVEGAVPAAAAAFRTEDDDAEDYLWRQQQRTLQPTNRRDGFGCDRDLDTFSEPSWRGEVEPLPWEAIVLLPDDDPDYCGVDAFDAASSVGTGRHTDPGIITASASSVARRVANRIHPRRSKDDGDVHRRGNRKMKGGGGAPSITMGPLRRKLPLLLCKSTKAGEDFEFDPINVATSKASAIEAMPSDPLAVAPSILETSTPIQAGCAAPVPPIASGAWASTYRDSSSRTARDSALGVLSGRQGGEGYDGGGVVSIEDSATVSAASWNENNIVECRLDRIFEEEANILNREELGRIPSALTTVQEDIARGPRLRDAFSGTECSAPKGNVAYLDSNKNSQERVAVDDVVRQFGGVARRSAIQRRKEQLERKWAQDRPPAHVRKVKWQARGGAYKKKVVLDYTTTQK